MKQKHIDSNYNKYILWFTDWLSKELYWFPTCAERKIKPIVTKSNFILSLIIYRPYRLKWMNKNKLEILVFIYFILFAVRWNVQG